MPEPDATVFVVEDDPSVREALAGLIRSAGWSVEVFDSAHEFLAHPKVEAPAHVRMPGMRGTDLQRELSRRGCDIPTVFITAHDDEAIRPRALAAGAVDCLLKPFTEGELLGAIRRALPAA